MSSRKMKPAKQKTGANLVPGAPPSFGGASGLAALFGGGPTFGSNNNSGQSSLLTSPNQPTPPGGKLHPTPKGAVPVLPSLNLPQRALDNSILDRDDYFGKHSESQWGVPTAKPRAPETISGGSPPPGLGGPLGSPRPTPRSLPSMSGGQMQKAKGVPNTSLLDAERPKGLSQVPGSQAGSAVDYNLLLSNPLKPAFQGLAQRSAFDSQLITPRQH